MMIHDGFSQAIGNAKDMRELADLLDQQSDNIAGVYADRTGKTTDFWRAKMRAETWYTGEQAVAEGLADYVTDTAPVSNSWDLSLFRNVPGQIAAKATTVVVNADGTHAPMTGTHTHAHTADGSQGGDSMHSHEHTHDGDADHGHGHQTAETATTTAKARTRSCPSCSVAGAAHTLFCAHCGTRLLMAADDSGWVQDPDGSWRFDPDGDGDDDSTPEGDTDHDWFDADGNPIPGKKIPPCPGAMDNHLRSTLLNTDVDNSPWDASKAWHNGASADDPAAFYKGICAGRKSGDPSTQDAWALPYKYHPSDPPNAAGVRNALARIGSTQGLTNKADAQSLLERLMKQVNPDYEPADLDSRILQSLFTSALEGSTR
jgi:hypothetical protein